MDKDDIDRLLKVLPHALDENRRGLRLAGRFAREHMRSGGILDLTMANAAAVVPGLRLRALPAHDTAELRTAGLSEPEILALLRRGLRTYRDVVARGAGLIADGARDLDKDTDEALGISGRP